MWPVVLRIIVGALLVVHGVAHVEITKAWGSGEASTSWLVGDADTLGTVLSTVALAGFALSGLAVFVGLGIWRPLRSRQRASHSSRLRSSGTGRWRWEWP